MTSDEVGLDELVFHLARRLRHGMLAALEPWQVAPGQLRALRVVERHGPLRLSDLATHLAITPRSTTEVVDALEQRGLVSRTPDPDDRRAVLVEVTPTGVEAGAAVQQARRAEAQVLFGTLGETDKRHLRRILGLLVADE